MEQFSSYHQTTQQRQDKIFRKKLIFKLLSKKYLEENYSSL